jgi:rsbT co-antagonist protein RsbR
VTLKDQDEHTLDAAQIIADLRAQVADLERKEAEHRTLATEVRRQKFFLEKILDVLPINVFVKDEEGRFMLVNEPVCRIARRERSEVLGRTDFDIFPLEVATRLRADDAKVRERGAPLETEERFVMNGETRYMLASKTTIRFEETGETLLVGFSLDITSRKAVEHELREMIAVIERQREVMLELSSPVIRVWEGILVMPLIGEISDVRAKRMVERLLEAIVRERARQVILDLTGVPSVDMEAASALLRTANAARLIGARCVIVGLSPEVARSLAELSHDPLGIEALATLEEALREAILRVR